jgi:hypothetical protein
MDGESYEPRKGPRIRIGGLLRCCLKTIEDSTVLQHIEGEKVECRWCSQGRMRFRDGAWEWDRG